MKLLVTYFYDINWIINYIESIYICIIELSIANIFIDIDIVLNETFFCW